MSGLRLSRLDRHCLRLHLQRLRLQLSLRLCLRLCLRLQRLGLQRLRLLQCRRLHRLRLCGLS